MPGATIRFGISARRVRVQHAQILLSIGGSVAGATNLAAGQASGPGVGTVFPTSPVYDTVFLISGGQYVGKVSGTVALYGTVCDIMARCQTNPCEVRLYFADSVEGNDNAAQFALMRQCDDLPPTLVPADGTKWTVVARSLDIGFARFFFPQMVNVGSGATGDWRLCIRVRDRTA